MAEVSLLPYIERVCKKLGRDWFVEDIIILEEDAFLFVVRYNFYNPEDFLRFLEEDIEGNIRIVKSQILSEKPLSIRVYFYVKR